jgi:hypothetical protein
MIKGHIFAQLYITHTTIVDIDYPLQKKCKLPHTILPVIETYEIRANEAMKI